MILTDVGEIGVEFEGLELFLSPSLYAMSNLGSPKEIVDVFHYVMGGSLPHALAVIQVCADGDIRDIYGYIDKETFEFVEMFASPIEILIVAQSLLKHGVIGDVKRETSHEKKDYTGEFHAKEYVAMAVAHLGIDHKEAWKMTMTSLAGAMQSKYPPQPSKYMSEEREEELLEWFKNRKK